MLDGPLHPAVSSLMLLQGEAPGGGSNGCGPRGWCEWLAPGPSGLMGVEGGGQGWGRDKSPSAVWAEWAGLDHVP